MKQKSIAELMSEMCMMKKHLSSTLFLCRSRQNENITGTARMTLLPDLSRVVIPLYWHLNLLCNSRQCCLKYLLLFLHDQMLRAAVGHMSHRNVQLYYRCCPCDCKSSLLKPIKTILNPFLLISPSGLSEMQSSRGLPVCIPELRGHAEELNPPPHTLTQPLPLVPRLSPFTWPTDHITPSRSAGAASCGVGRDWSCVLKRL